MPTTTKRQHDFTPHRLAKRRDAGSTFIEFAIVIAIIAIIAAVTIPSFKRYLDRARAEQAAQQVALVGRVEATHAAERSGLKNAEVVGTHDYIGDRQQLGCWGTNDAAYEIEGIDGREQRVRMTVCCRPGPICALPPRPTALPPER